MSTSDIPIRPDGKFTVWLWEQVYRGPGKGRYIPNVDDAVWDWESGLYRVTFVNATTGLSILEPYNPPEDHGPDISEFIYGGERQHLVEDFCVYIDDSVTPHTLAVDTRRPIYGTTKTYAKLFLGTNIGAGGEVISAMYDPAGTFLGENVPLEKVAIPSGENIAVKIPAVASTNHRLDDGEVVTCVIYNDDGHATDIYRLIVKNTAFIRVAEAGRKYVLGIHLESPFLSPSDFRTLEFPINMPIQSLPVTGVVTYSDGTTTKLPLGSKFMLHGLDNYIATIKGQKLPLTLVYNLSEDEYNYGSGMGEQHFRAEQYWAVTKEFESSFTIKLFTYPEWVDAVNGYRLKHYLYNLDRQELFNVTNKVKLAANSGQFNPLLWGSRQELTLELEMSEVSRRYPAFRHVQTVAVVLERPPSQQKTKWLVYFTPGQADPFGRNAEARTRFINVNHWKADISLGEEHLQPWLQRIFWDIEPLHHDRAEVRAPEPNFMVVVIGSHRQEAHITEFDKVFTLNQEASTGKNIYIEFIHRTHDKDLQLGIAALPCRKVNAF